MKSRRTNIVLATLLLTASLLGLGAVAVAEEPASEPATTPPAIPANLDYFNPFNGTSMAGDYLSGRFAQQHHDWTQAEQFMDRLLQIAPDDIELKKRTMVLAMGSGDTVRAVQLAGEVIKVEPESPLALLFLTTDSFVKKDYAAAQGYLDKIPQSGISDFIIPLFKGWADAAQGNLNTENLQGNAIHIYHAILISDYLKKPDQIEKLLEKSLGVEQLTPADVERIADVYAHIGKKDKALELYGKILASIPGNKEIITKMETLAAGKDMSMFRTIESPEQGITEALFDTAQTLAQEYSDDSARV
ncbi:MAG TPA: hypothetical protein DEA55_08445, partial [Rhodospirillaceae bacterium]|nr:hypothetical protein [Rhodospirillaceae bacterium]